MSGSNVIPSYKTPSCLPLAKSVLSVSGVVVIDDPPGAPYPSNKLKTTTLQSKSMYIGEGNT
jgi:hypothetical protein